MIRHAVLFEGHPEELYFDLPDRSLSEAWKRWLGGRPGEDRGFSMTIKGQEQTVNLAKVIRMRVYSQAQPPRVPGGGLPNFVPE